MPDVASSAMVSPSADIADDVTIGPFTVVHDNVRVGPRSKIESHCVLGVPPAGGETFDPLVLGADSWIRSHSVFYGASTFGDGLRTGHRVTVREGTRAGAGLQLGTLADVQGRVTIGDHVRTHSNVHIGQLTTLGDYVWVFPYCVFTNDPHPPSDGFLDGAVVEDFAVIATMTSIMPGVRIGARALVGAHSLVNRDVEPDTLVVGVPARAVGPTSQVQLRDGSGPAYPWMRHFHRGYPPDVVAGWAEAYRGSGPGP